MTGYGDVALLRRLVAQVGGQRLGLAGLTVISLAAAPGRRSWRP